MLWYKAWRESRGRFLIAFVAIAVFSVGVMLYARTGFPLPENPRVPYSAFVWGEFYSNSRQGVFCLIALLLGLGGLQRERAGRTASFTLALPITRGRLLSTRAMVGLLELTAIALVPVIVVPALSPLARQTYPLSQSVQYGALFMSWGVVWFAVGVVWSVVFAGEWTATAVSVISPFVYMIVYTRASGGGRRFIAANPFEMMSGGLDHSVGGRMLLTEPLPWLAMLVLAAIAATLLCAAWRITLRQDF